MSRSELRLRESELFPVENKRLEELSICVPSLIIPVCLLYVNESYTIHAHISYCSVL